MAAIRGRLPLLGFSVRGGFRPDGLALLRRLARSLGCGLSRRPPLEGGDLRRRAPARIREQMFWGGGAGP
eukprot:15432879-Alexandrium_andersonii.AAC.1